MNVIWRGVFKAGRGRAWAIDATTMPWPGLIRPRHGLTGAGRHTHTPLPAAVGDRRERLIRVGTAPV